MRGERIDSCVYGVQKLALRLTFIFIVPFVCMAGELRDSCMCVCVEILCDIHKFNQCKHISERSEWSGHGRVGCRCLSYRLLFVSFFLQSFTDYYYFDECFNKLQTASVCWTYQHTNRRINTSRSRHTTRPTNIGNVALTIYFYAFTFLEPTLKCAIHRAHAYVSAQTSMCFFNVSGDTSTSLSCSRLINRNSECSLFRTIASFSFPYQPVKCEI